MYSFFAYSQICERWFIGVDDQEILYPPTKEAIDFDLALMYSNNCTGPRINSGLVFNSGAIAEDNDESLDIEISNDGSRKSHDDLKTEQDGLYYTCRKQACAPLLGKQYGMAVFGTGYLLFAALISNDGLKSPCPISQSFHVRLVGKLGKLFAILLGKPGHIDDRQISSYVEYVESEFECVPWSLKPIRVYISAWRCVSNADKYPGRSAERFPKDIPIPMAIVPNPGT